MSPPPAAPEAISPVDPPSRAEGDAADGAIVALRSAGALILVAAACVAATAVQGLHGYSAWNVAIGASAAVVLLGGAWMIPAVFAGGFVAAWSEGWRTAVGQGAASVLACGVVGVVAGLVLRRLIPRDPARWTVRDVVVVVSTAMSAGVLMAAWVWMHRTAVGVDPTTPAPYFGVWVGSAAGLVLALPAVASVAALWRDARAHPHCGARLPDVLLHALLTLGVGAAAYLLRGPTGERFWSLYFLPLLWTAFRFGTHGVVVSLALVSVQGLALAVLVRTPATTLTNYHFFLFNFAATELLLAAALGARRSAERARGRSEALLAGALRIMDDGLVLLRTDDGTIVDTNDAWLRLAGRTRESLAGASLFALPEWVDDVGRRLHDLVRRHEPVSALQAAISQPTGAVRAVEVDVEYVTFGAEAFAVAFVRDVTESRLLDRQRLQSQKLEAVGLLAGGVAHDFNNILTVISTAGELLHDDLPAGDPRRHDVDSIMTASRKGAQLTRQLLAFSRQRDDLPPREWSVADVVVEMMAMLRRLLGSGVEVETQVAPDARVLAAPGQLEQVILNLAINARDAMDGRGRLHISARAVQLPADTLVPEVESVVAAGSWTALTVRDTGMGIDPAVVSRIFEPFFTTKPEGRGTGLGLSTVYGIVKTVGGHVGVRSEVGVGTEFVVWWPAGPITGAPPTA